MKALVIVDMQEDYIGKNPKYKFSDKQLLIEKINLVIYKYKKKDSLIIYVKNNIKAIVSLNLVGVINASEFVKTIEKLKQGNVIVLD